METHHLKWEETITNRVTYSPIDWQVTNQDVENLKFYAQWAGSAYCNDDSEPGESVVCSFDICPDVESHNATIISSFR